MRAIVTLLVIVVLALLVGVLTGFINLQGRSGSLPKVEVSGGSLPKVDADVGRIDLGTKNTTVEVPTVETKKETVKVPTVDLKKPQQ